MGRLLLATHNAGKLAELRRILHRLVDVEVVGLDDVDPSDELRETGATFGDNALLKARAAVEHTGFAAVADDSGLAVDALNGMPGVLSARWSGGGDDEANLRLLLAQLADTPDDRLGAAFVCAAALVTPDGTERITQGRMPGRIVRIPRGSNGFGYDPIFVPDGQHLTSGELPSDVKDAISHRGQALRALAPHIVRLVRHEELSSGPLRAEEHPWSI
jgi:XTP/dITP diphosphohydrolase